MANIKNNNNRKIDCRLFNDTYMDFMLSKDDAISSNYLSNNCLAAQLNFFNHNSKHIISNVAWEQAITSDKVLENINKTDIFHFNSDEFS